MKAASLTDGGNFNIRKKKVCIWQISIQSINNNGHEGIGNCPYGLPLTVYLGALRD